MSASAPPGVLPPYRSPGGRFGSYNGAPLLSPCAGRHMLCRMRRAIAPEGRAGLGLALHRGREGCAPYRARSHGTRPVGRYFSPNKGRGRPDSRPLLPFYFPCWARQRAWTCAVPAVYHPGSSAVSTVPGSGTTLLSTPAPPPLPSGLSALQTSRSPPGCPPPGNSGAPPPRRCRCGRRGCPRPPDR